MVKFHSPWMRLVAILALTFVAVFSVVQTALAAEIVEGETIAAGEVIEDDAIITGEDVVVDGTVDGDLLAFGNTVTINGSVSGSLIAVGEEIFLNGQVGGTVYATGVRLELNSSADTSRNVYYAGFRILTEPGASVGRDLTAVAVGADFAGQVGRNLNARIGIVELIDRIRETITGETSGINGSSRALGWLAPSELVRVVNVSDGRLDSDLLEGTGARTAQRSIDTDRVAQWITDRLVELIILFIVGGLALLLMPARFERWSDAAYRKPLPAAGIGLLTYILGYGAAILLGVLLLVGGLILMIAVAWQLGLTIWVLGFSLLIVTFVAFVIFVSYVSKVILAYLGGRLILDRVDPDLPGRRVLSLLLGLLLYVLLVGIPTLGTVIAFLVTILGLGAIWMAWLDQRRLRKEQAMYARFAAEVAEAPAEVELIEAPETGVILEPDAQLQEAMELGRRQAESDIQTRVTDLGKQSGAWTYNDALGSAASSDFDRALLAVTGILGASREQNVYYLAAEDSAGEPLRADKAYRVIGKDLPARWWSVTAYDPLYLIPNEQDKYSINKTTIAMDEDGNWEAFLGVEPQENGNWIDTGGGDTDLQLALRLYNPSPEVLENMGAVALPEIRPVIEERENAVIEAVDTDDVTVEAGVPDVPADVEEEGSAAAPEVMDEEESQESPGDVDVQEADGVSDSGFETDAVVEGE
jgi:cytoskeletal protein CcmA (bactofilin family)